MPPSGASPPAKSVAPPEFTTIHKRTWMFTDVLRALLIVLSLVVAAGLILVLLPQRSVDRMAQRLEARRTSAQPEQIALLYLGNQTRDNAFHIRGVIRNISSLPIEQLDASVRLYGHDGSILETTVVRMDKQSIAPDEIAQFDLVYPNYRMEFSKYSVEFKLREGGMVSYKDMRATR